MGPKVDSSNDVDALVWKTLARIMQWFCNILILLP